MAAGVSLAVYAITLGSSLIYDDRYMITEDPRLKGPKYWRYYWTEGYFIGAIDHLYRPLTSMTYGIQYWLHGQTPWPYHLVNWLAAAVCAGLVAALTYRLAGRTAAVVAGLVFAVHPVHVEAVAGIVGRAEMFCTIATFSGLLIFLRRPLTWRRVISIWACFVLAVLTKEQGILLPMFLLAAGWLRHRSAANGVGPPDGADRTSGPTAAVVSPSNVLADVTPPSADVTPPPVATAATVKKRYQMLAIGLIYFAAAYLIFRESILPMAWDRSLLDWHMNPLITSHGIHRWLVPFTILGRYVELLVFPRILSIDYGGMVIEDVARISDPHLYLGIVVGIAALLLLVRAVRQRDLPVAFGLFGAAASYGVVSNFFSLIGTTMGERLMFMPSAFLSIVVGAAVGRLADRLPKWRPLVWAGLGVALLLGTLRTVTYAARWDDQDQLFVKALDEQPKSFQLHQLVYSRYEEKQNWAEAKAVADRCIKAMPDFWQSYALAAYAAASSGDEEAMYRYFKKAKELGTREQGEEVGVKMWARKEKREAATRPYTRPATQETESCSP